MPLPERYEPILKDFFAGKITGKEMARTIEEMDNRQMSLNFVKGKDGTVRAEPLQNREVIK